MQTYYSLTTFFNNICLGHPNVEYFTIGDINAIDNKKQPLFPLAHLMVNNVSITPGAMTYNVTLFVMDRANNIQTTSFGPYNDYEKDWKGIDNSQDIWNTSLMTINDITSYIYRNPQALDYQVVGSVLATPFEQRFDSLLWGWAADMNISVGNIQDMCVIDVTDFQAEGGEDVCR